MTSPVFNSALEQDPHSYPAVKVIAILKWFLITPSLQGFYILSLARAPPRDSPQLLKTTLSVTQLDMEMDFLDLNKICGAICSAESGNKKKAYRPISLEFSAKTRIKTGKKHSRNGRAPALARSGLKKLRALEH